MRSTATRRSMSSSRCPVKLAPTSWFSCAATSSGRVQPRTGRFSVCAVSSPADVAAAWSGCPVTPEVSKTSSPSARQDSAAAVTSAASVVRLTSPSAPSGWCSRVAWFTPSAAAAAANSAPRTDARSPETPCSVEASPWVRQSTWTPAPAPVKASRIAPSANDSSSGWATTANTDVHDGRTSVRRFVAVVTSLLMVHSRVAPLNGLNLYTPGGTAVGGVFGPDYAATTGVTLSS